MKIVFVLIFSKITYEYTEAKKKKNMYINEYNTFLVMTWFYLIIINVKCLDICVFRLWFKLLWLYTNVHITDVDKIKNKGNYS